MGMKPLPTKDTENVWQKKKILIALFWFNEHHYKND